VLGKTVKSMYGNILEFIKLERTIKAEP